MPLVEELFGGFGAIRRLPGRSIKGKDLKQADVLLVRSVTQVDQQLLDESPVRFVGSATIGTDHIDIDYLQSRHICFAHAPGCNAEAVVQYDLSVFCRLRPEWRKSKIGIVGCGNVGGRLYRKLQQLGVATLVCDPFLSKDDIPDLVDFEEVLGADILCLHTPLTASGPYPTHHMINSKVLDFLGSDKLLLNAGRGAVVDNRALLKRLVEGADLTVALDVWESEPDIPPELLRRVAIGTPHIAGYTREGKERGTRMVYRAFLDWLSESDQSSIEPSAGDLENISPATLNDAILQTYDVLQDDRRMRSSILSQEDNVAVAFDRLRRQYPERHEFSHFRARSISPELHSDLGVLRFSD